MWYLVVPPIVVVLSLSFLLWYLSRKGTDPMIAKRVQEREGEVVTVSFPRTKEFFLRMLEKGGQHFKVTSLRMHNTLHEFTQSVKASRMKVRTAFPSRKETKGTFVSILPKKLFDDASVPIFRKEEAAVDMTALREGKETVPRPMVSEIAMHPEKRRRSLRPNALREEDLIARIARDPKDFTAYESLGDYYLEMENIKDAKECYRQVLKLSPVHRMVKIKIRRLERLLTKAGE